MKDLIKALSIFLKYRNERWPTYCEHDTLHIVGVTREEVSEEDKETLTDLSFFWSEADESWVSYRYGSA